MAGERVVCEKFNYNKSIYIIVGGGGRIATNRDKVDSLRLSGRFVIGQKKFCALEMEDDGAGVHL